MAKLAEMLSRIRIVPQRSSTLTKTVVLVAVVLSMAALLALGAAINNYRAQAQALKDQAAQLEQENEQLEENIEDLGSADSVEQIARDELGLVDPDTVVIQPEE